MCPRTRLLKLLRSDPSDELILLYGTIDVIKIFPFLLCLKSREETWCPKIQFLKECRKKTPLKWCKRPKYSELTINTKNRPFRGSIEKRIDERWISCNHTDDFYELNVQCTRFTRFIIAIIERNEKTLS